MIDFSKITKTVDGMDCRYIHERESNGERIHVFALFNEVGERYEYYNQQGKRLKWSGSKWELEQDGKWKIYEPRIVEVTRWIGYYWDKDKGDVCTDYYVQIYPDAERAYLKLLKITESIEVPND